MSNDDHQKTRDDQIAWDTFAAAALTGLIMAGTRDNYVVPQAAEYATSMMVLRKSKCHSSAK